MCRAQCILALVVLFVGLAHSSSWEGRGLYKENVTEGNIIKFSYDPVGNRVLYYEIENKGTFIFSYDLKTKKSEPLVPRIYETERIDGIAFDPVEQILFWNVYFQKSIYWLSLKPGAQNNVSGNFLIKTSDYGTSTIAIDSCNGYIYWTSKDEVALIERARFDGSSREVVIRTGLQKPRHLAIDPQKQRLYWSDGTNVLNDWPTADNHFSIESSDLNGNNRTVLYRETGLNQPLSLALSKDYIYWSHFYRENVWQLPKIASINAKPEQITTRAWDDIVTNYEIKQIKEVQNCNRLMCLLQKNCHNYCFHGGCSVSDEGPQCRCDAGYSGERCEINLCHGYCLNDGDCSLNKETNAPVCHCRADYEGKRCEISACLNRLLNKHFQTVSMLRDVLTTDVTPGTLGKGVKSTCAATIF